MANVKFGREGVLEMKWLTIRWSGHGFLFVFYRLFPSVVNPFDVISALWMVGKGEMPVLAVRRRCRPVVMSPIDSLTASLFRLAAERSRPRLTVWKWCNVVSLADFVSRGQKCVHFLFSCLLFTGQTHLLPFYLTVCFFADTFRRCLRMKSARVPRDTTKPFDSLRSIGMVVRWSFSIAFSFKVFSLFRFSVEIRRSAA